MALTNDDYDSPWKEALEHYFEAFIAFFFPNAHQDIDWRQGYEFLDKELQQVVRDAELGKRLVDKLVKVRCKDGTDIGVLVYIEIQGQADAEFARRMYVYHYRLFDRYQLPVVSMAVLADRNPTWRPSGYHYALWGCRLQFDFPVVKLDDYRERWSQLQASANPFAALLMAHLKTQDTQGDTAARLQWKLALVKNLYQKNFSKQDVLEIYRFIDWLMVLPPLIEQHFINAMLSYEQEIKMPYISSAERIGIQQGEAKLLKKQLLQRFGRLPDDIGQRVDEADIDELEVWAERILDAQSLADVFH